MRNLRILLLALLAFCYQNLALAQSPGLIVRPAGGNGVSVLNPNGDAYSSATSSGFSTDDIAQSEIGYKVVPAAMQEPTGDLSTGPSGGYTDIVTRVDGSGFYLYKNATNIFFRLRIGGIISGSKAYTVLIDTDGKMGNSGASADPNYVAPAGSSPGNPGFEYEVSLQTNFQVAVYSIDGTATPGTPTTYNINSNSQISVALSTDGNNPDYFYDWFVPLSAIGNPSSIRVVATTVSSPNSALQGTRSDIYGINDALYANTAAAWQAAGTGLPAINLTTFTGVGAACTAPPTLTGPIGAGSSVTVSGTWTRLDASKPSTATITLYQNGSSVGTVSATTGNTWSMVVPTIANGDVFYAMALAAGESSCLQSNSITATGCLSIPTAPVLTCGSLKGISGTMPSTASGNTVVVYAVPTTSASPFTGVVSNVGNLTYPTTTSFAYFTNGCSGGSNNVATGTYMIVTQNGSCFSPAVFVCISSGSSGAPPPLGSNALTLTTPIYPFTTTVNGSGASSGDILRLFINGQYNNSITATGSSFSFTGLTLSAGDQLVVYSQTGTNCMTQSSAFTVSCYTPAPSITTNATGNLLSGATSIAGTSASPGASVQVYKGTAPSGVATGSPATVAANGTWSVTVPALTNGETYYAQQTLSGCASAASSQANVLTPASCPTITGSYTDASTTISGTMPSSFTGTIRLYEDGVQIGSQSISATTSWSITVSAGTLYYGGTLTATAQATGGAESSGCGTVSVNCTSAATPSITPTNSTITAGQTVTYTVSNVASGNWYALLDNTGKSYATSLYKTNNSGFSLTTNTFSTAGTYNLKLTADALTGCPASFASSAITVNAALPLTLISFSGLIQSGYPVLSWSTSNEINVSHFELEESADGNSFAKVARLPLQTTNSIVHDYQYTGSTPINAPVYYRLRTVDNDGKSALSKTLQLRPSTLSHLLVSAGPNPFNANLQVKIVSDKRQTITITITDAMGNRLKTISSLVVSGDNTLTIENLGILPAGNYHLHVGTNDGQAQQTIKLIKR